MEGKSTKKKDNAAQNATSKPLKAAGKKNAARTEEKPKKKEVKEVKSELDAIDDLFATAKRKSNTNEQAEAKPGKKAKKPKPSAAEPEPLTRQLNREASLFSQDKQPEAKPVRFDEDGLPIYKEDDLKINQGGWTEMCPFDCDCCF